MANLTANKKDGRIVSYKIKVFLGRDDKGKQIFRCTTWQVSEGLVALVSGPFPKEFGRYKTGILRSTTWKSRYICIDLYKNISCVLGRSGVRRFTVWNKISNNDTMLHC